MVSTSMRAVAGVGGHAGPRALGRPRLLLPALVVVVGSQALWNASLARSVWGTLVLLLAGVGIGALAGTGLALAAALTRVGEKLLQLLTSIMGPLPGIAVLPIALLWFGLGPEAILVATVAATIWPLAGNLKAGFDATSPTLLAVGRSIGLSEFRLVTDVRAPTALPYAVAGLRTASAAGWQTLVAGELVVGFAGGEGGLGTYIANAGRDLPQVLAAVLTIASLSVLFVALFGALERMCGNRGFSTM